MAITGVGNYNSVYENTYAASRGKAAKKEETGKTSETTGHKKSKSTLDYADVKGNLTVGANLDLKA